MINVDNTEKLYECLIEGKKLTTKELNSYGFTSKDLTKSVNNSILKRIKRGVYTLTNVDDLYSYGKKLISLKQYDKATRCFEKCYEIDSSHPGTNFQLFLRSITNKDYSSSFQYLDILLKSDNPYYKADAYFYLYLLTIITKVPEKYKEIIANLTYNDMKISILDKRCKDVSLQNKIRLSAFQQNIFLAFRQYNVYENKIKSRNVSDILIKTLLFEAHQTKIGNLVFILDSIERKEYEKIIVFLKNEEQENFALSDLEYDILKLSNALVNIIKTNEIPEKTSNGAQKLRFAIRGAEYERALELCLQSKESVGLPDNKNAVYLLLVEINKLIEKINESKIEQENIEIIETEEKNETKKIKVDNKIGETKLPITQQLIDYALKELLNNSLDNAFRAIYTYLSLFDKNEYEFLVINLIKLDLIQKDYTFNRLINILKDLSNDEYYFDENEYIKSLYECLNENKLKEAEIYLNIVSKRNEELKNLEFESTEEKYKYYRQLAISRITVATRSLGTNYSKFLDIVKKNNLSYSRFELGELVVTNPNEFIRIVNGEKFKNKKSYIDSNKELIESKIAELKQGRGFVVLGKMTDEKISYIKEIVGKIPDVACFIVGTGDVKTIALKHRMPYRGQRVDFKPLIQESQIAYDTGDYEKCISLQKEILAIGKPKARVFAKIGLAYMKQFKTKTAIEYLSMATLLSQDGRGSFDFTDLIDVLSGNANRNDQKNFLTKKIKMQEQDFIQDDNYGITNFNEIKSLVSNGMNINEACMQSNLNEEQTNIFKLLLARERYAIEDYITGDRLIKNVEQSKTKTSFVRKLIDEIRKNKIFYKNRVREEDFVKKISL